jgi:hypothetical protein
MLVVFAVGEKFSAYIERDSPKISRVRELRKAIRKLKLRSLQEEQDIDVNLIFYDSFDIFKLLRQTVENYEERVRHAEIEKTRKDIADASADPEETQRESAIRQSDGKFKLLVFHVLYLICNRWARLCAIQ